MTASPYTQLQTGLDDRGKNERMMKRNRKTVCLIYVVLFSISGCNNAFFEVDTKVKLEEGATPPRFYLTGNGASPIFLVFGPYDGQIPDGYVQRKPKDNRIPTLLEGKEYHFYVHVDSANGGGVCFRIQSGEAVKCK